MRLAQPLRFVLVGIGGFALNVTAFAALLGLSTPYVAASVFAFMAANAAMYVGNRYFTFGLGHEGLFTAYVRYAVVGVVVATLAALLLLVLVEGLEIGPRTGQALALSLLVPVSFLLSKRFAFRLHPEST